MQEELIALLLEEEAEKTSTAPSSSRAYVSSTLIPLQPEGTAPPLFLVGAFHFRLFAEHLGRRRPVYGLVGRNLDKAQEYMGRVEEMAAGYVEDIQSVQPQGPYYICGFCFGGLVAYEIARQLQAQGERVAFLGMLDTYSPLLWRDAEATADVPPPLTQREKLALYARRVREGGLPEAASVLRTWLAYRWFVVSTWSERIVVAFHVRVGHPIPDRLLGGFTREQDTEAARHYAPKPYRGPVTIMACEDAPEVREGVRYLDIDPTLGWRELVEGPITTALVAGGHGDFLREPRVRAFAEQFARLLGPSPPSPHPAALRTR